MKNNNTKIFFGSIILVLLIAYGCYNSNNVKTNYRQNEKPHKTKLEDFNVSGDSLIGGDIFVSAGAAGKMEQKQGKIVLISDSGDVRPVLLKDDKLLVTNITGDTLYRISLTGNHKRELSDNPDTLSGDVRLMLMTDDGKMLQVKLLGGGLVAITGNNIMLPLEKK